MNGTSTLRAGLLILICALVAIVIGLGPPASWPQPVGVFSPQATAYTYVEAIGQLLGIVGTIVVIIGYLRQKGESQAQPRAKLGAPSQRIDTMANKAHAVRVRRSR
jgi:hypothetical protein